MNRLKLAELTSGVGALVLGVGIGALLWRWIGGAASTVTAAGLLLHAVGMWDKHRLERSAAAATPRWAAALYWTCWALLAVVTGWLAIGGRVAGG